MKYRLRSDGSIKTQGEIRNLHKNSSLPKTWNESTLEYLGVDPIFETPKPTVTDLQVVRFNGVVQDEKGNWVEDWTVEDRFSDYTNEEGVLVTKAEQEAEYLTQINTDRLAQHKEVIRKEAEEAYDAPVTLVDGSVWNGGMDSALAIDGAVRMAENAGLTSTSLYDLNNVEVVVDIQSGKEIAMAIGADYQVKFAAKQAAMRELDAIDLSTTTAKDEINAVTFTY